MGNEDLNAARRLLRATGRRRDVYEGAHPQDTRRGSGRFYVTYSAGHHCELTRDEVRVLEREGLVREDPDCPHLFRSTHSREIVP